jgi:hypothetical protein
MTTRIFPSSFRCDCGDVSHLSEGVVRSMVEQARKRGRDEGIIGNEKPEHTIWFSADGPFLVVCPELGRREITGTE